MSSSGSRSGRDFGHASGTESGAESATDSGTTSASNSDSSRDPELRWPYPGWISQSVGGRISVRITAGELAPSGRPGYRDIVGFLESATDSEWLVRTRDGTMRRVDPADVVAAKRVPDVPSRLRAASDIDVASLELIAAEGWQPLEREDLGQWRLRAAEGYTGRANSVLPIGGPGVPIDDALAYVRSWYSERALKPRFQVPLPLRADLEAVLAERGWTPHQRVHVMVADLGPLRMNVDRVPPTAETEVSVTTSADAEWRRAFRYGTDPLPPSVAPILTASEHPVFVTLRGPDAATRAVGRGVLTARWLGVTAVEVVEPFRRQGLGRLVIGTLAAYAAQHGARHVYLQVASDNNPAKTLYERLGFVRHHDYVYRMLPSSREGVDG